MFRFYPGDIVREDAIEGEVQSHDLEVDEVMFVGSGGKEYFRSSGRLELVARAFADDYRNRILRDFAITPSTDFPTHVRP